MKILMLGCKEYPYGTSSKYEKYAGGGTAKYVISLSKELAKLGHEIHLIVRKFPEQKEYEHTEGLHIHRIKTLGHKYFMLPSFALKSWLKAKKLGNFDIIHTHNPFVAYAALNLKGKKVATIHGIASTQVSGFGKKAVRLVTYLEKKSYPKFDKVVFLHDKDYEKYKSIYGVLKNYTIIHSGIEFKKIVKKSHKNINILFAGRLENVKGAWNLVQSYPLIPKNHANNIRYIILGDGSQRVMIEQFIKEHNLKDRVIMKGFQNDIYEYMKITDLFILPSYSEGFPITILEAASQKVPCLINNFKVPFKKNSLYVMKNNNPQTIADSILAVLSDKNLNKKAEIAFNDMSRFTLAKMTENYATTYKNILSNKAKV